MSTKVYLAGPMRGLPEFNFPAFLDAEGRLSKVGLRVHNPARMERDSGFDPTGLTGNEQLDDDLRATLGLDLDAVIHWADAVVVLPGWENNTGANAEVATALALGKMVFAYDEKVVNGALARLAGEALIEDQKKRSANWINDPENPINKANPAQPDFPDEPGKWHTSGVLAMTALPTWDDDGLADALSKPDVVADLRAASAVPLEEVDKFFAPDDLTVLDLTPAVEQMREDAAMFAGQPVDEFLADVFEQEPEPEETPRGSVLLEARDLITGDRNAAYGPPTQDFRRTADAMNALGYMRLDVDGVTPIPLQPSDVAIFVAMVKISRLMHSRQKRDNWTDLAGYAGCGYECAVEEGKEAA